jgi:molybdate transport system substrate-binding protein
MNRRDLLRLLGGLVATGSTTSALATLGGIAQAEAPLHVFAAASLAESLTAVVATFRRPVVCTFDASSKLARQIGAGAPADLFFSADEAWMDHLADEARLLPGTRRTVLSNRLVLIAPAGSSLTFEGLPTLPRIALAGESVPAGKYARASLQHAGIGSGLADKVVSGDSVRTVLTWVANGEAPAGIVYASDAIVEPRVRIVSVFPMESHPPIRYPLAAMANTPHPEDAKALVDHIVSPSAQATFYAAGFSPPVPG